MTKHYITWWNIENLFDVHNSENRPEWLAKELKHELKGWTKDVLDKKLANLSSVIKQINDKQGPDIFGFCEVESKTVAQKLCDRLDIANRDYRLIHKDTKDNRGIDIAFIYDANKYTVDEENIFSYEVIKRSSTRDILQISFTTVKGNELIIIGNHWPARSAGQYKSEPYRIIAGETLSYWLKRIQEIKGKNAAVVVMGDFNDEPYSRSLTEYALSSMNRKKVIYGRNPYLYNLMWQLLGERKSSYVFNSEPLMIDQFLVSKGIVIKNGTFRIKDNPVKIDSFQDMTKGRYFTPVRFGRPSSKRTFNQNGFSDHLPVSFLLFE